MANTAYQVTNGAYQGDGVFVYQGSTDGAVVTPRGLGGGSGLRKRVKKKKIEVPQIREQVIVELVPPVPVSSLRQVMAEMEKAGFDFVETEEEDDALIMTFLLKKLH